MRLRSGTLRSATKTGPRLLFKKSMKLPLSQTENQAISEAHGKAVRSAAVCAKHLKELLELLETTTASVDENCIAQITNELQGADSASFQIKMRKFRVQNTGLEGREFKAEAQAPAQQA
jgi:formiminotetrahydrofolate cyclodeaminase